MEQDERRSRPDLCGIERTTHWAGVLLCYAHAVAMLLTAAVAFIEPAAAWWSVAWVAAWVLTGVLLIVWALLRAGQKRRLRRTGRPCGPCEPGDPGDPRDPGDPCGSPAEGAEGYGRAA
ncbi:phage holin family protein [Streptomyces sp. cmx-18-6]|uniref:phage holin family protein n=1 Tax=Streptomyces sp. cmx-18-6 TaxID=2790930 RepID=UPI003980F04F